MPKTRFEVKAGRLNLVFLHAYEPGYEVGPFEAYYLDPKIGDADMGINYTITAKGKYRADFICYPESREHFALAVGDTVGTFDSEAKMIDAFKKWLKSLELPMYMDVRTKKTVRKKTKDAPIMKRKLGLR